MIRTVGSFRREPGALLNRIVAECVCGERGCSMGQVMHIKLEKNDKTGLYSEKESMGRRGTIH